MEHIRQRHQFVVVGYVVLPEHVALWSTPVAVGHIWQRRFYDFVVFTEKKRLEKLRYMHRNPVQRSLVLKPEKWLWSSFRHYAYGDRAPVPLVRVPDGFGSRVPHPD